MGLQFSKRTAVVVASSKSSKTQRNSSGGRLSIISEAALEQSLTRAPAIAGTYPTAAAAAAASATATAEEALAEVRQIIIKIQLAKMENGNEEQQQEHQLPLAESAAVSVDTLNANEQIVNVNVGVAATAGMGAGTSAGAGAGAGTGASRTAGSSTEAPKTNERQIVNNNNLAGTIASVSEAASASASAPTPTSTSTSAVVKTLQLRDDGNDDVSNDDDVDDDDVATAAAAVVVADEDSRLEVAISSLLRRPPRNSSSAEGVDYCEVLEQSSRPVNEMLLNGTERAQAPNSGSSSSSIGNSCCRSRSSKALSMGAIAGTSSAAVTTSRRRCCKCKCRDALRGLRGMLESSSSQAAKDKKEAAAAAAAAPARSKTRNSADRRSTPPTLSGGAAAVATARVAVAGGAQLQRQRNSVAVAEPSQLAIWAAPANGIGDVIIRISSQPQPQFVMEPAARNTLPVVATMGHNIRLVASTEPGTAAGPAVVPLAIEQPACVPAVLNTYGAGVTVHSQIDFMHCLVPDLERIINSSFYWGKMDRYEAERLLEGKPEGTFLLRDSAQEEFLFSVTFRKYGRSLHARIEQSGHKFSFDCHDPCVFAALTVTGLLEHYKDPSCVMFFEPCLTMPLHRRQTFSLQELARATIVSNTTYDGINQLELPGRLKSYLKEYHYKQKLRVKPCDAHIPAPYYANI